MAAKKELIMNSAWCKGCGICVAFCPKEALELSGEKVRFRDQNACILCGLCELRCPDYAIYINETEEDNDQWAK